MALAGRLFIALLLCLAGNRAAAADLLPRATKQLDTYFDSLQQQGLVNGSLAISERGVIRYRRSVGFASIENGVPQPADAGTRYRIGGVTRLFTAALTIQLAELATITLDNKLAEFYPELPDAVHITYRNLLQQRSGLADYTSAPDFAAWRTAPRPRAELLQIIAAGGTHFPPGDRVEINDTNYLLLGYVIEKVREKSYDELLRTQITSKLGLARTYFAGAGTATTLEARSYRWTPQGWQVLPDDDPTVAGGASGVISNAGDLVTFMDAMFASKIVTSYSLASMRDDEGTGAGIALRKNSLAGQTAWGESAQVAAYETAVWHLPDRKITIAWTGNAARVPMDQVLDETLARVFKRAR